MSLAKCKRFICASVQFLVTSPSPIAKARILFVPDVISINTSSRIIAALPNALVDAEIVQEQASANHHHVAVHRIRQRSCEYSPLIHKHAESTFYVDAQLTDKVVEVVFVVFNLFTSKWHNDQFL